MFSFYDEKPHCGEGVFIAEGAYVIGRVTIGRDSSVFYNSVVRGDVNSITIGEQTNIQDSCVLHVTDTFSLQIGSGVTAGHSVVLHGCTIGDNVLVGIGAIVLDGAVVGDDSIVAAGSLVAPGKEYPPGSMIMGSPAKVVRNLTEAEKDGIRTVAGKYLKTKKDHAVAVKKLNN